MTDSRNWLRLRLAALVAVPLIVAARGDVANMQTPREPRTLAIVAPLQAVDALPDLVAVPADSVAFVGMDFVPPVPEMPVHGQRLPVEDRADGLGQGTGVRRQGSVTQRLPSVRSAKRENEYGPGTLLIDRLDAKSKDQPVMPMRIPPVDDEGPVLSAPPVAARAVVAPRDTTPRTSAPQRDGMQAVRERAVAIAMSGERLADRGAYYSARAEFVQALRVMTQALDAQSDDGAHSQALSEGLRALSEAEDFAPSGSRLEADLNLASIVAGHRTPVLKDTEAAGLTPLHCLQRYYGYAREKLIIACGREAAAAPALYGLGRLTTVMAQRSPDERRLHAPKAMALYQAALALDSKHARAAHELGVLYAQFGQYDEAKQLLVQSATIAPRRETWQNLAVIHDRLGETDLAFRARNELQRMVRSQPAATVKPGAPAVTWVDPAQFAGQEPRASGPAIRSASRPAPSGIISNPWLK